MELDYDDQCDFVFGRLRRLANDKPEALEWDLAGLALAGLKVGELGVSGEQVQMAFEQLKAEKAQVRELQESVEDGWCVIANASDWDAEGREEWRVAAERWRDRYNGKATPRTAGAAEEIECPTCSLAGGAGRGVFHAPPVCSSKTQGGGA